MVVPDPESLDPKGLDPATRGRTADLLTIGLLVFFVSLLVVVAALLVLPATFG
jgi:hypothetical protein